MHDRGSNTSGDSTECFEAPDTLGDGVGNKVVPVFAGFGVNLYFFTGRLLERDTTGLDVEHMTLIGFVADHQV